VALSVRDHAPPVPNHPLLVPTSSSRPRPAQAVLIATVVSIAVLFPADHMIETASVPPSISARQGDRVFDAHFSPDGHEFGLRYVIGEPDSASVRFVDGGIEYSVLKPDGNTGNALSIQPMPAFLADFEISVKPKSDVAFWINFTSDDPARYPLHQVVIQTAIEAMQLAYDTGGPAPSLPVGPQVSIDRMLTGRHFTITTLVAPPIYRVFLDGVRVIDVRHESVRRLQAPTFAIFGNGGTVRINALRVYRVNVGSI